ncbi:hypothetical protein N7460_004616 [Penicillium canescens]|uniref:Pathway-specific nitrogen regulator n=1 Tax=Penicillium canescens TaxID=5083 RepID=A0AAD6ICD8_PENCN|nr:hypothetical protein N7460_004616 [Penicillium canescens]KAJ6054736.1 hypothetical protein N7444_003834 [Penicillium canescens]
MARLNDDSQHDASTDILSPQPFTPQGKGFLVSSLESKHSNAQMSNHDYEYNSSSSSTRHSTSDVFGHEMDEELEHLKSRASSRSSLSSIPASVLIHPVDRIKQMKQMPDMDIHEKIAGYNNREESEASFGDFNEVPANIRTIRQREAAFRKPSSVRALQMHTEDEADDDDYLTPPRRRAGLRSPGSSPLKRSPYYSPNGSQSKPKAKKEREREKEKEKEKEFPLVLLHCTILSPSIPVPGATDPRNQDILEETLPPEYWKRWRRLQDRVGSGVLRDRGVLISHPEDLYDMLEERLLESLELQRPRLQNGHFLGREENDTASEREMSDVGESETDGEQGDACPDCGSHVRHGDSNRKWEIRVFAANGLLRAGAWAAAWRDMEKVDVEVGLWLPSDVRRALERRLGEESMALTHTHGRSMSMSMSTPQMGSPSLLDADNRVIPEMMQSPMPGYVRMVSDAGSFQSEAVLSRQALLEGRRDSVSEFRHEKVERRQQGQQQGEHQVALRVLIVNYLRVLAADRRNVALVLLSVLVAFLAIGSVQQQLPPSFDTRPLPRDLGYDVLEPMVVSSTSVALAPSVPVASSIAPIPTVDSTPRTGDLDEDKSLSSETPKPVTSSVEPFAPTEAAETFAAPEVLETPEPEGEELPESSKSSLNSAGTSVAPTESSEVVDEAQVLETAQSEIEDTEEPTSPSTDSVEPPAASVEPTGPPQSQSEELEEDDALVDSIRFSAVSEEPETATEPPTSESNQSESDIQEELS